MNYFEVVTNRILTAINLMEDLFNALVPLYRSGKGEEQEVTVPLFTTLHSTSVSILILVQNQSALHDADILLRSVMEGTIKYCYIMNGTQEQRSNRYHEYRHMIPDIDKLSDHVKAVETIDILKEFSCENVIPAFEVHVLSEDDRAELQKRYPKEMRRKLKQKWGYQSILRDLANEREVYKTLIGTLSTYALTSHFCHYDWTGLSSRTEQIMSSYSEAGTNYDVAHCFRIVSNVLSFEITRASEFIRVNGLNDVVIVKTIDQIMTLLNELQIVIDSVVNEV